MIRRIGLEGGMPTNDLPDQAQQLEVFARKVLLALRQAGASVATAESCTGGLLASLLTDIEGFGAVFDRGFVTYKESAKVQVLGIPATLISRFGIVSAEVAQAMADGAQRLSEATIAVGITGYAGPAGKRNEEGLVHIAVVGRYGTHLLRECHFGAAGRDVVRLRAAHAALEMIDEIVRLR